jgi:hypothetical protein
VADEQDQRSCIVVGRVQGDHGVGNARAARNDGNAGPAGQFAVRLRHVAGARLVPADDQLRRSSFDQRAGESDVALAGHAEDAIDAVRFETLSQDRSNSSTHDRPSMMNGNETAQS